MSTAVTLPFALNCQANGGTRSAEGNRNASNNTTGTSPLGTLTIHPHHNAAATDSLRAALVWNVVSGVTASTSTTLQAPQLPPPRQWRQRRTPQAQGGASSSSSSERRLRIVDILDEAIAMFENDWATMDDLVRSEQSLPDTTDHHHHHHHRRDFEERQ
jgi:uncharacterized protein (DUF2384 family)